LGVDTWNNERHSEYVSLDGKVCCE
jgi:hypothetical protein